MTRTGSEYSWKIDGSSLGSSSLNSSTVENPILNQIVDTDEVYDIDWHTWHY